MDISQLRHVLAQHSIDATTFGHGDAKTLEHLRTEIEAGETVLAEENGTLKRVVSLVSLTVLAPSGEHLVEDRQVFKDGRVRRRGLNALAEKFKPGEDPLAAAKRALEEELGLPSQVVASLKFVAGDRTETEDASPSHPGLISVYRTAHYSVTLPPDAYDPEGYVEHQVDKRTYFRWEA